ncbi:MAG: gamma-glutamyl-gamma-aminobutyrate hydrolase family protein [Planctomycetota bacterium]
MRAVVLLHEEHEHEGWFGPALQQAGFTLERRFREVRAGDADAGLVVVLGGPMAAFDVGTHPFLAPEVVLLADRLRRGAPCLGICLGAQLLARAAGADVHRGAHGIEIGGCEVQWTAAGQSDPVVAPPGPATIVAQWHQDTWRAVPRATPLARSARYPQQAFRLGASFAFQFHLELGSEAFAQWLDGSRAELAANGHHVDALLATIPALRRDDAVRLAMVERLAAHFARAARTGATPR